MIDQKIIPDGMIHIEIFAKQNGKTEEQVVEMVRDGLYVGQIIDGTWYVKLVEDSMLCTDRAHNRILSNPKVKKAIFISPLVAPVVYFVLLAPIISLAPKDVMTNIVGLIFYGAYAFPMGYVGAILIMLPIITVMKNLNILNQISLMISGFITGGIFFTFLVSSITHYYLSDIIASNNLSWFLIAGGVMGTGVAYKFSAISGITKPSSGLSR